MADGTYVPPVQKKSSYGTMVMVRVMICVDCFNYLKKAATIAIRYSAVRRQVMPCNMRVVIHLIKDKKAI